MALASALAFDLLVAAIIRTEGPHSKVARAMGRNVKGRLSIAMYATSMGLAFVSPWISYALLAAVSVMWFVPDGRLAR